MRGRPLMIIAVARLLVAGCETEQELVQGKEDMLAASGFIIRPASTPERQAAMKTLKPHTFVYEVRNNKPVYLYSDPTVCDCLYIGTEQAYQQYRKLALQKQIADEQMQAAQMQSENFDMAPWGGGWW